MPPTHKGPPPPVQPRTCSLLSSNQPNYNDEGGHSSGTQEVSSDLKVQNVAGSEAAMVTSGSKSDSRNAEDSSALPHLEKSFLSETVRGFEPEGKNYKVYWKIVLPQKLTKNVKILAKLKHKIEQS
jgi:hypothetical protein